MNWWRDLQPSSKEYLVQVQREFLQAKGGAHRERWREVLLIWWDLAGDFGGKTRGEP